MQHPLLWERIVDYDFPRGFQEKLCEQFGCRVNTAIKLTEEYRRFVYLAMISPSEATPSEQIDQVWHLHLSYTRDYWKTFCADVLRREFHHDPCDGVESRPRYEKQYSATLALYEQEFGSAPPFKAWPTKGNSNFDRFGAVFAFVGFIIAFLAMFWGGPNKSTVIGAGLLLVFSGMLSVSFLRPYDHQARRSNGGGGGTSSGCGGGCGGGGG